MSQRSGVGAALAACGVDVTLDGVVRLVAGLVQRAQVHPGGGMAVVQLYGADVCLQSIHGLVLLLVQNPEEVGMGGERMGSHIGEVGDMRLRYVKREKWGGNRGENKDYLMMRIEER